MAVGDSKGHLLGTAWKGSLDDGDMRLIGRRGEEELKVLMPLTRHMTQKQRQVQTIVHNVQEWTAT